MKKSTSLIALVLLSLNAIANPIDPEKAEQIAADFLPSTEYFTLVSNSKENRVKAFGPASGSAPYYIYSRGEGQGYVIVAGDDCLPTILGYTESGDFDADNIPPALQAMLDSWAESIAQAQANGTNTPRPLLTASADRSSIKPIMTSHWHQSSPYNDRCPIRTGTSSRAVTGCVATAASQILYYWRKDLPSTLQSTTPTYSYGEAPVTESIEKGTLLRWDLMKDSYNGSESATVKNAVAEFVFATGAATWLTYGSSTSGNIEKIPATFSGFFGMKGGTVKYRNSYSQETWVQMLYDELIAGRPVMYTGQSESQGGHAVVVHGYQKTGDLFYFNFGWGGQADGYYTVDTEKGMNGFNAYQSALFEAYPKTWNRTAEISQPETVYAQRTNTFDITIENNSTLPLQGVYLFASTSSAKPSLLRNAKSSDLETIIPSGSTGTISLTCKPTSTKTWYITATDADLTVLDQIAVTPETVTANLSLSSIISAASGETETIEGIEYNKFYSKKASLTVRMNNEDDMAYEGTGRINIYVYDEDKEEWVENGHNSLSNILIPANASSDLYFTVANTMSCPLVNGKRYYAEVATEWSNNATVDIIDVSKANPARTYFTITGESDFAVSSFEDGVLSFSGHWDKNAFELLLKLSNYSSATCFDMTQVEAFTPNYDRNSFNNPNTLVYVAGSDNYKEDNIINADGICQNLRLVFGYDFKPKADFKAKFAVAAFTDAIGKWSLFTAPFNGELLDGAIARRIDSHKTSGTSILTTTDVVNLEAGQTYLVMTSSEINNMLWFFTDDETPYVDVLAAPTDNVDSAVKGTFVRTTAPKKAQLINDASTQYFVPLTVETEVGGLTGYFYDPAVTKQFRVNTTAALDPAYISLANNIAKAYDILSSHESEASPDAYVAFIYAIFDAESKFTHRDDNGLNSSNEVRAYADYLLELAEKYIDGSIVTPVEDAIADVVEPTIVGIYNLSGVRIPAPQHGVNIYMMSDGTSKKILIP